ncbi:hypothetical protein IKG60_02390 [Candidatus Saccharibacteria bacterium]|nr:hypothetical protein [Candidatus Saccharibacteria bacterium]
MIRIFTGEDRVRAKQEITKLLGDDYEVVEGAEIETGELMVILKGNSLFNETRRIVIRDLGENKVAWEKLPEYLDTVHEVVIFETKLDKRSAVYKKIKDQVEIREFARPKDPNFGLVFDIYRIAKRDGVRAVRELKKIELTQEPMMFFGLIVSQALKDYKAHPGITEKKALKELSRVDMELKSVTIEPWLLIEALLIRLASL